MNSHRHQGHRYASLVSNLNRSLVAAGLGVVSLLTLSGCPSTVDCVKEPQNGACVTSVGNATGVSSSGDSGVGATGNTATTNQSAATCSKACTSVADCACGRDAANGACAVGRKECIDASSQCPDFCTGITGKMRLECVNQLCALVTPGPDENSCSKTCATDTDCACGKDARTGACAVGRKECINTASQCPDFCTGITGKLRTQCANGTCVVK